MVRTERLPEGTLFVSPDGVLYQVVMAGSAGFRKAEPWPWLLSGWVGDTERPSAVALVPGSLLARNYPVVAEGKPLSPLDPDSFLDHDGQPSHHVFADEQLAKLAAHLDETLVSKSGLMVRKKSRRWLLSDGRHIFRVYHYWRDEDGINVDLRDRFLEEKIEARPCTQGPKYWQYIPGWSSSLERKASERPTKAAPAPEADVASPQLETEPEVEHKPQSESANDRVADSEPEVFSTPKIRRAPVMLLSVDIGYGYTKGVGIDDLHFSFPSVIGTAEEIHFAADLIRGREELPVQCSDWRFFYGEQAVLQSRVQSTIFDRSRVHDDIYKMLFIAALVETAKHIPDVEHFKVVTGLPVDFFSDRAEVVDAFEGLYRVTTNSALDLAVESVIVVPQPFGSLFRELLNDNGKIINNSVEQGRVGVIDIGTYTTDFVVADALRYVQRLSGSISIGWSQVVSQVGQALRDSYMLDLMPHEVDRVVQTGEARVRGEPIPLEPLIAPAVNDIKTAIIARARDLWGSGANLDQVLVTGGGGPRLYEPIHQVYPHAHLLHKAFWANAEGFYRFGQRPAVFEKDSA